MEMTLAALEALPEPQKQALREAQARFPDFKPPFPMLFGDGAIVMEAYKGFFLVIEPDGYTHS